MKTFSFLIIIAILFMGILACSPPVPPPDNDPTPSPSPTPSPTPPPEATKLIAATTTAKKLSPIGVEFKGLIGTTDPGANLTFDDLKGHVATDVADSTGYFIKVTNSLSLQEGDTVKITAEKSPKTPTTIYKVVE